MTPLSINTVWESINHVGVWGQGLHADIGSLKRFRISRGNMAKKFSAIQSIV
jgi:hypothetical protein